MDGLLEQLGAGGGRVFSVAPAASPYGSAAEGAGGGRLLEHLGWPCSLRMALLVRKHMQITVFALDCGTVQDVDVPTGEEGSRRFKQPHMHQLQVTWHEDPGLWTSSCRTFAVLPDLRHKPDALQRGCDLTGVPRKSLLRLLGEHCADAGERHALLHLSSRGGRDAYNAQVCCHIMRSLQSGVHKLLSTAWLMHTGGLGLITADPTAC